MGWAYGNINYNGSLLRCRPKLNDISIAVIVSKQLEQILVEYYGASNSHEVTFADKLNACKSRMNRDHVNTFYKVKQARNDLAHKIRQDKFSQLNPPIDREQFIKECQDLFAALKKEHYKPEPGCFGG